MRLMQGNSDLSQQMMRARVGFQVRQPWKTSGSYPVCQGEEGLCVLVATTVVRCLRPLVFAQFVTVALMAGSSGVYALQQARSQPALSPDKEVSR